MGLICLLATTALLLPGCTSDGHFTLFGYTTVPNYDCSIRTVHVPIVKNRTFRRGLEFDFTRALIREIEAKTPFKVVDSPVGADTELDCTIVSTRKSVINANQLNEIREGEITVGVEVIWRDLRPGHTGEFLSAMGKKGDDMPIPPEHAKGGHPPPPRPVLVIPSATFVPEVGGSRTSAEWIIANKLAIQIVSMMEIWGPPVGQ